jgi:outer membrane protein assembly factor BamB
VALRVRTACSLVLASFFVLGGVLAAGASQSDEARPKALSVPWTPKDTDWPAFHFGNDRGGQTSANASMKFAYYKWSAKTGGAVFSSPVTATIPTGGVSQARVFIGSSDSRLYCLDGGSGRVLWRYQTNGMILMGPAVGDLEGNGTPSVVFGSNDGRVHCLEAHNGSLKWRYTTRSDVVAPPALSDLNADGRLEVAVGSRDGRFYVLDAGGRALWTAPLAEGDSSAPWGIQGAAAIGDVNGDGRPEVVVQSADNNLTCLAGSDGKVLWNFRQFVNRTASTAVSPCIADIDLDGSIEVVAHNRLGSVACLRGADGSTKWEHMYGATFLSTPAIGDADQDGRPEIVLGATDWIYCLNGTDGYSFWQRRFTPNPATNDVSMDSSPALADIDGDGRLEIVIGGNDNMLHALNAEDGSPRWAYPVPKPVVSSPAVADIDGDGKAEMVFGCKDSRVFAVDYSFA